MKCIFQIGSMNDIIEENGGFFMITINAYGYNVTGNDKIISVIMDMMNDNEITINWNNFKNNDIFWNGDEKYYVEIDHDKKEVFYILILYYLTGKKLK